jgi:hypothetical protein
MGARILAAACLLAVSLWLIGPRPAAAPRRVQSGEPWPPHVRQLLEFHRAQDAGDVGAMLLAAERLERLGEEGLARHVRHAARELVRDAATPR